MSTSPRSPGTATPTAVRKDTPSPAKPVRTAAAKAPRPTAVKAETPAAPPPAPAIVLPASTPPAPVETAVPAAAQPVAPARLVLAAQPKGAEPKPSRSQRIGPALVAFGNRIQDGVARAVRLAALVVGAVIVVGIALVLGGANVHNGLVRSVYSLTGSLVHPFAGDLHQPLGGNYLHNHQAVFGAKSLKKFVVENWGLAVLVYVAAGLLLSRMLRFGRS